LFFFPFPPFPSPLFALLSSQHIIFVKATTYPHDTWSVADNHKSLIAEELGDSLPR
jgi:hypothetical protein